MRTSLKAVVVTGTTIATLAVASGIGYAYVRVHASGSASHTTASHEAYKLDVVVGETSGLAPGTEQSVLVTVTNKGPSKVQINSVALALPSSIPNVTADALDTVYVVLPSTQTATLAKNTSVTFTGRIGIIESDTIDQTSLLDKSITVTATID